MAHIRYRTSTAAATPTDTVAKGAPLTNLEVDGNFKSLNDDLATKAPISSPALTGTPTAPTATAGTNTTQIATTAFVETATSSLAPKASPALTGTPTAPTATVGTNTTQIATTAFVSTATSSLAPKASPALTGTPTAPTATAGTNTTQIATTEFVATATSSLAPKANPVFTGTATAPQAVFHTPDQIRIKTANAATGYGVIHRNDGTDYYVLLTNNDDADGTVNALRPLKVNLSTGAVTIGTGLTVTGTVTATDFNSTSDASLKENVQDLQHTAIDSVRPVAFNWKETGEKSYGVIAQELEAVFPELVKTDEAGIKSVSYIPLISMLVAKVQYLESEIEKLKRA